MHRKVKTGQLSMGDVYDAVAVRAAARSVPRVALHESKKSAGGVPPLACYNCSRVVNAARFAPHLDKCLSTSSARPARRK